MITVRDCLECPGGHAGLPAWMRGCQGHEKGTEDLTGRGHTWCGAEGMGQADRSRSVIVWYVRRGPSGYLGVLGRHAGTRWLTSRVVGLNFVSPFHFGAVG